MLRRQGGHQQGGLDHAKRCHGLELEIPEIHQAPVGLLSLAVGVPGLMGLFRRSPLSGRFAPGCLHHRVQVQRTSRFLRRGTIEELDECAVYGLGVWLRSRHLAERSPGEITGLRAEDLHSPPVSAMRVASRCEVIV